MATARHRLAKRRKELGYSQEKFAEQLGVDRTTVGRWERGEITPHPPSRPAMAILLEVTPSELDALLLPEVPNSDSPSTTQAMPGVAKIHVTSEKYLDAGDLDEMIRREFLRVLSIMGTLVAIPPVEPATKIGQIGDTADLGDAASYMDMNSHLWQVFSLAQNKRAVYPIVREQLASLNASFQRAHSEKTHKQLCAVAGDLFQLAGEIFFDSNRYTDAAHCYALAVSASREARNPDLWACALTRHAFIGMYENDYKESAPLLAVAARVARQGDRSLSTRHWVAAVQAEAFAGLNDLESCKRALDEAEQVHSLSGSVHNGGWLRFDGSRLAEERGTCYVTLGRLDLAETALNDALAQTLSLRRKGSVLTDLALLGARRKNVDQLLNFGTAALELAQQSGSGYVGRKLKCLQAELSPFLANGQVSDLHTEISDLNHAS
ncbi:helix-turn-helix domain-containing protein [Streptomyces sp. SID13588]|uniref:helix-turn-helix domain-containing protein n=1 Tax=Streptomyces sp. SID13588 TaxID=2706051 RepID=UPI0013C5FD26|nr:helix-turn-helix domain-containing protein [Streptomyces sp. SID13588]NEA74785.1 helix-turn-helix transcriptional regulator [Streptomyces sp. SID13588]